MPKVEAREIAVEKLARVGLGPEVADLFPAELSGGMRKRAGLARAIAADPQVIFFDEPTTGLDPIRADAINDLILLLQKEMGVTSIVITHDMVSAFRIGTRMIMLGTGPNQGKIIAAGTPEEIRACDHGEVQQFINGEPDGPVPLRLSKGDYVERLLGHPGHTRNSYSA